MSSSSETHRRVRLLPQLLCAVVVGIAEPHVELLWKCRAGFESSEACVWGRSYLPLGRWLAPIIVTPIVFVVLVLLTLAWRWVSRARRVPG